MYECEWDDEETIDNLIYSMDLGTEPEGSCPQIVRINNVRMLNMACTMLELAFAALDVECDWYTVAKPWERYPYGIKS